MDIREITGDIEENERQDENMKFMNEDDLSVRSKKKIGKKKIIIAVAVLIIAISAAVYLLFFNKKPAGNFLSGQGGPVVISNKPITNTSLIINPHDNSKNKNELPIVSGVKNPLPSAKNSAVKTSVAAAGKSAAKPAKAKNSLNDLFTVKYHNNNFNSMNPVMSSPLPPMPAQVSSVPNFSMPNLKNMANKLKGIQGFKPVSLTVSGYAAGMVAAKCGGSTHYLKAGNSICGYVLLKADSSGAVFSRSGKIKKIAY